MIKERFFRAVQKGTVPTVISLTHIALVYLLYREKFLIFQRADRRVGTISGTGKINMGIMEPFKRTCCRELLEETGIKIFNRKHIHSAQHSFYAISHKGKFLYGQTFFTILNSNSFTLSDIKLNHEMTGVSLLTYAEAIKIIEVKGYPEQLAGLKRVANIIEEQMK